MKKALDHESLYEDKDGAEYSPDERWSSEEEFEGAHLEANVV